jgi:hypothetical protein
MSEDLHAKAQKLLSQSAVEGLQPAEDAWLRSHMTECVECARGAAALQEGLRALRSVPVLVPKDLAARTQSRVRVFSAPRWCGKCLRGPAEISACQNSQWRWDL